MFTCTANKGKTLLRAQGHVLARCIQVAVLIWRMCHVECMRSGKEFPSWLNKVATFTDVW